MTETASLVIKVDSSGADRATRNLRQLDRAADNTERAAGRLSRAWGAALGVIGSAAVVGVATRAFVRQADAFANMSARVRLVTGSMEEQIAVQQKLFALSQEAGQNLEAVTDLYTKLGMASEELAANQTLLVQTTETVSKALALSGADAATSAAVIRQFAQAMGAGALRGDELVSIMEGAPVLIRAIADGMGVTVGEMRKLGAEGKLLTSNVLPALISQSGELDAKFQQLPLTVGRATQQVKNALLQMIGTTDQAEGASRGLAESIAALARTLESEEVREGFGAIVSGLIDVAAFAVKATTGIANFTRQAAEALAVANNGISKDDLDRQRAQIADYQKLIDEIDEELGRDITPTRRNQLGRIREETRGKLATAREEYARNAQLFSPVRVITGTNGVTLPDSAFRDGQEPSVASAIAGTATPQITEQAAATRELSDAEQDLLAIEGAWADERLRAFQIGQDWNAQVERQKAATRGLIDDMRFELSLIGKSNEERAKAVALRYAGAAATDEEKRAVADLAVKIEQAREAEAAMYEVKRATSDLFADVISGSMSAGDAFEAFGKRLVSIAAQVIADKAVQALFEGGGQSAGATGGGFWGSLVQGIAGYFGGGRAGGGPVMAGQSYLVGEHGPEVVTFGQNGRVSPSVGQSGGQPIFNFKFVGASQQPESTTANRNSSGGFDVEMIFSQIEQRQAGNMAAGTGPMYAATKGRFGLRDAV